MLSIRFVVVCFGRSTCLIVYMPVTHIDDLVGGACVLQLVSHQDGRPVEYN